LHIDRHPTTSRLFGPFVFVVVVSFMLVVVVVVVVVVAGV
jgi:hypothetical protein